MLVLMLMDDGWQEEGFQISLLQVEKAAPLEILDLPQIGSIQH